MPAKRHEDNVTTADIAESATRDEEAVGGEARPSHTAQLFEPAVVDGLRSRWTEAQTAFVDEPRRAVEQADQLVAETMKRLSERFASEREKLEREWDRGSDVSTEDLRVVLQRYRAFFDRLLSL